MSAHTAGLEFSHFLPTLTQVIPLLASTLSEELPRPVDQVGLFKRKAQVPLDIWATPVVLALEREGRGRDER